MECAKEYKGGERSMKPGYLTTEFWVTAASQVIGVLALFGVVEPSQTDPLTKAVISAIGGVLAIVTAVNYIWGRTWLKRHFE